LCDYASDLTQSFLKGFVRLLMLAQFSFQHADILVLDFSEGLSRLLF
jgi:hypothetical protein